MGLRDVLKAAVLGKDETMAGSILVPLGNACPRLRGCSHASVTEKSSQRGMVTEQSHVL